MGLMEQAGCAATEEAQPSATARRSRPEQIPRHNRSGVPGKRPNLLILLEFFGGGGGG